jgi:hypothetical protein
MKKQLWQVVGFLAALLATSSAIGQTNRGDTITDIPFAFTVANNTLPPGRYTVTGMSETTIWISNSHKQGTVVLTTKVEGKPLENAGKMVFHRYGDAYFLSEVWGAASGTGRKVFQSRAEQELCGKQIEMEIAVLRMRRLKTREDGVHLGSYCCCAGARYCRGDCSECRKQGALTWVGYEAYLQRTRSIPEKSNSNL